MHMFVNARVIIVVCNSDTSLKLVALIVGGGDSVLCGPAQANDDGEARLEMWMM
jgi:hypothetical protein